VFRLLVTVTSRDTEIHKLKEQLAEKDQLIADIDSAVSLLFPFSNRLWCEVALVQTSSPHAPSSLVARVLSLKQTLAEFVRRCALAFVCNL
jgi:hypothetical protein